MRSVIDELWLGELRPMAAGGVPPGVYVALGPVNLPSWFLCALCPVLAMGRQVFWLDAGNRFDVHGASYAARSLGFDPRPLLARVRLARPFNLFQLETMVRRRLPDLWRGEPVVLADPFPMFYDEDVPLAEARRVARSVLEGMRLLPAPWLVLAVDRPAPKGREGWLGEMIRLAASVATLEPTDKGWRCNHQLGRRPSW